jgi:SWI/SNF-related matrix-associated actin-dependent regulator 1 of chromatin subfamily A
MVKFNRQEEAFSILEKYRGSNPYILYLQKEVYALKNVSAIKDLQVDYILRNANTNPRTINKIVKLADWYGEKKKEEWGTDFIPKVVKIISYLGETEYAWHCYVQYRTSVAPKMEFLSKRGIIEDFLAEDYHNVDIDFTRYTKLSQSRGFDRELMSHQEEAVKFLISRRHSILADDMGLGKSSSLTVASIEGNFDAVIIICPASLKTNWKNELSYYVDTKYISIIDSINSKTKSELEEFLGYKQSTSGKTKDELLEEAKSAGKWKENKYVIVNYDILDEFYKIPVTRSKENILKAYNESPMLQFITNKKSLIIIDEAHNLSNNTSIRYKIIKSLLQKGKPHSVFLSTGTPITNNPQNLLCLLELLDEPIAQDRKYYLERYCDAKEICHPKDKDKRNRISTTFISNCGKRNWYELNEAEKNMLNTLIKKSCRMMTISNGASNLDELKCRISHIYLRRIKEEMNNMVTKTVHEKFYDLTSEQKKEYDRLWDEYEQAKLAEDPTKELNKELLEGAIYRKYISNQMTPHTIELVNKLISRGEKVVVACCYDEELYALKEYYGDKCVIYNGKTNLKQKDEAIKRFYEDDSVMVFIGNIVAASTGINLVNSRYLVFNNISYVYSDNSQMEDRIYRVTQKRDVHVFYQIFRDTQYENMWNISLRKKLISNAVIKREAEK